MVLTMYDDIKAAIEKTNSMIDEVKAVIIRSTGKLFAAGNDITELSEFSTPENTAAYLDHVSQCMCTVYESRVPVIAAVQGAAIGGAMALVSCCDVIIASEKATFSVPEIRLGMIVAADFFRLMVPEKVARYYCYTGDMISAQEVKQYGGVHKVVPAGEEYNEAVKVAQEFLKQPPRALEWFKEAMNVNANHRLKEKYATEIGYSQKHILLNDFKEATSAFLEKRTPVFTGK